MLRKLVMTSVLLSTMVCFIGCGGSTEPVVNAPPEAASTNVDADRAKEATGTDANVDYSKPQ